MKRRVQSKGEALRVLRLLVIKAVLCSVRAGVSLSSKMGHGDKLIVIPPSWLPLLLCSYRRIAVSPRAV